MKELYGPKKKRLASKSFQAAPRKSQIRENYRCKYLRSKETSVHPKSYSQGLARWPSLILRLRNYSRLNIAYKSLSSMTQSWSLVKETPWASISRSCQSLSNYQRWVIRSRLGWLHRKLPIGKSWDLNTHQSTCTFRIIKTAVWLQSALGTLQKSSNMQWLQVVEIWSSSLLWAKWANR